MAMRMVTDKSEILVHISAPSGAVDDARYRAQVEAILNFQARSREIIVAQRLSTTSTPSSTPSPTATEEDKSQNSLIIEPPPRASPGLLLLSSHPHQEEDSLDSPVSVIPDSQPQIPAPESGDLHPASSPQLCSLSIPLPPSKRRRVDSPPPPPPPLQRRRFNQASHSASPPRSEQAQHHTTQNNNNNNYPIAPPIPIFSSTPVPQHDLPPLPINAEDLPQNHLLPFPTLPLEIRPSPPPVSTSHFVTHVTPTLEMLTNRLMSPRTYTPTTQTRALDKLERGHWYLHINLLPDKDSPSPSLTIPPGPKDWDMPFFSRFWSFLSNFIAKEGRAGWGVWCILDEGGNATEEEDTGILSRRQMRSDSDAGIGTGTGTRGPGKGPLLVLKVYAWGEVACHIYLLLFLASERRIRKMGAQWRDSRDEVVIQMP